MRIAALAGPRGALAPIVGLPSLGLRASPGNRAGRGRRAPGRGQGGPKGRALRIKGSTAMLVPGGDALPPREAGEVPADLPRGVIRGMILSRAGGRFRWCPVGVDSGCRRGLKGPRSPSGDSMLWFRRRIVSRKDIEGPRSGSDPRIGRSVEGHAPAGADIGGGAVRSAGDRGSQRCAGSAARMGRWFGRHRRK